MEDQTELSWHKSSYSGNGGGSCVEVSIGLPGRVAIRDTKNLAGPVLMVSGNVWTEFVDAIKLGELDL
jgi:hypothetical protein